MPGHLLQRSDLQVAFVRRHLPAVAVTPDPVGCVSSRAGARPHRDAEVGEEVAVAVIEALIQACSVRDRADGSGGVVRYKQRSLDAELKVGAAEKLTIKLSALHGSKGEVEKRDGDDDKHGKARHRLELAVEAVDAHALEG